MDKYTYLFPFESIPFKSKILIYGAGDVGEEYLKQMLMTGYCQVLGFVDRRDNKQSMSFPIYSPDKIADIPFDYIVLAFKTRTTAEDVTYNLTKQGIKTSKIIFQEARAEIPIFDNYCESVDMLVNQEFAFCKSKISVAIKMGSALGDIIIKKKLLLSLSLMEPKMLIDIYTPSGKERIQSIYSDFPQLNCVIEDGGAIYAAQQSKYGIAMTVFYMIIIDYINDESISESPHFFKKMKTHQERHKMYNLSNYPSHQNWIHFSRGKYYKMNCYSIYNYTNVFQITDWRVVIPFRDSYKKEYKNMDLISYITLNYGNGISSKGNKQSVSKQWPKEKFEEFVIKFKKKYPNIIVVQLGDQTAEKVRGVDKYVLGKSLELVKYILKGAIFHLDIEGGLVHLASQIGTKCVVLFGPTSEEFFGYRNNINISFSKCSGCFCLYDNVYQCAREMERPECMWSITPSIVLKKVEGYLNSLDVKSNINTLK